MRLGIQDHDGVASKGGNHTAVINYTGQWKLTPLMEARFSYNRHFVDERQHIDDPLAKELGLTNVFRIRSR
jgi:hypothetical protein